MAVLRFKFFAALSLALVMVLVSIMTSSTRAELDLNNLPELPGLKQSAGIAKSIRTSLMQLDSLVRKIGAKATWFSTEFPQNIMDIQTSETVKNEAISFGVYITCIGLFAIVVGLFLSFLMCSWTCLRICTCGKHKPKREGYKFVPRCIHNGFFFLLLALPVFTLWMGILYNQEFTKSSNAVVDVAFDFANDTIETFDNAKTTVLGLGTSVNETTMNVTAFFDSVMDIEQPLLSINDTLYGISADLNATAAIVDKISSNATLIKSLLGNVRSNTDKYLGAGAVPADSDIPTIPGDVSSMTSNSILPSLRDNVATAISDFRTTVSNANSTVGAQTSQAQNIVSQQLDSVVSTLDEPKNAISSIFDTMKPYKPEIAKYNKYREIGFDVVYAIPVGIFALGILGAIFNFKTTRFLSSCFMVLVAILCFILTFWYFALFAIHYTGVVGIDWTCENYPVVLSQNQDTIIKLANLPSNFSGLLNKTVEVLRCSGNTTLVDILGNDLPFELPNVTKIVEDNLDPAISAAESNVATLNITAKINGYKQNITDFKTNNQPADLAPIRANITNVRASLFDVMNITAYPDEFLKNYTDIKNIIANINAITNNLAPIKYFVYENTSTMNPAEWPSKQAELTQMGQGFNETVRNVTAAFGEIHGNLTLIDTTLLGIDGGVVSVNATVKQIFTKIDSVYSDLGTIVTMITDNLYNLTIIIDGLKNLRTRVLNIYDITGCSFIGDAYVGFYNNVCINTTDSFAVMAMMYIINGAVLFFIFFCACLGCKKNGRTFTIIPKEMETVITHKNY